MLTSKEFSRWMTEEYPKIVYEAAGQDLEVAYTEQVGDGHIGSATDCSHESTLQGYRHSLEKERDDSVSSAYPSQLRKDCMGSFVDPYGPPLAERQSGSLSDKNFQEICPMRSSLEGIQRDPDPGTKVVKNAISNEVTAGSNSSTSDPINLPKDPIANTKDKNVRGLVPDALALKEFLDHSIRIFNLYDCDGTKSKLLAPSCRVFCPVLDF